MKVAEIVTSQIVKYLEKGEVPWKQPWVGIRPQNFVSKREYSGINFLLLSLQGYKKPYFLTFNQVNKLGGKIKKGSKGTLVIYTDTFEVEDEDEEEKKQIPFIRYYKVFNIEQCEGIDVPELFNHKRKPDYEEVLKTYEGKPKITEGGRAFYNPKEDRVVLPSLNRFRKAEDYYSTMYHELVHSTGLESRLNRFTAKETSIFGSESYSKEELIAELGSAFLCARYRIDNRQIKQSAGYIQSWLKVLKGNPTMIISAASKAQKAVDFMVGKK